MKLYAIVYACKNIIFLCNAKSDSFLHALADFEMYRPPYAVLIGIFCLDDLSIMPKYKFPHSKKKK